MLPMGLTSNSRKQSTSAECASCCAQAENLVDPASSHMLVSKVKPCMCMYNFLHNATANGSIIQLLNVYVYTSTWIPAVILELTHD